MRAVRFVLVAAAAAALIFGAVTLYALEGGDVAVLVTTAPDGGERRTHVWFAEDDGAFWIEAATDGRPFFVDVATRPRVTLEIRRSPFDRHAVVLHGKAEPVPGPGGHSRIRALLAERYGWADAWVALLQDTSASRALRVLVDDGAETTTH